MADKTGMKGMKRFRIWHLVSGIQVDYYLLSVIFLSVFALGPLLQPGYFWGAHDARHSIYFLFEFDRSIQDGIWYPRWAPDFTFGYGYPFFNIYGPLAFYIGEAFHLMGFDFVASVKIVFGLAIVLSGVTMYLYVRCLMGRRAGLIAGLVYLYAPYHIADVYVRAALSETMGLVFLPLVLWGFYQTVRKPRHLAILGAGLAYAGLMLTSNLIALLTTPLLAAYLILLGLDKINRHQPLKELSWESLPPLLGHLVYVAAPPLMGLLLGLGLSAIFWLPAFSEYKYVRVDQWVGGYYDYRDDFIYFFQLFSPKWGFGLSQPGPHDEAPFQLGVVPLILSILSLAACRHIRDQTVRRLLGFFQVTTLAIVLLMLSVSIPAWDAVRLARFAQFPWRLLIFSVLSLAFLAGSLMAEDATRLSLVILAALIILGSYPYLEARIIEPVEGPVSLAGLMRFQQSAGRMTGSTIWVKEIPTWSPVADHYIAGKPVESRVDFTASIGDLRAVTLEWSTTHELVRFKLFKKPARLVFDLFYYPGWHAYLMRKDEAGYSIVKTLEIEPWGKLGKISVMLNERRHVLIRFEDTPVRVAGRYLSLASLILVLLSLVGRFCWRRHN
ncbi:MAG: glycosyltransferase family 39 protein, partial [Anaerolineae bacterium]